MLLHGGLSEKSLFLMKQIIEACIQGKDWFSVHKIGSSALKFRSQFHKE